MNTHIFHELLYYTGKKERKVDLYGEEDTALDPEKREEFLKKYVEKAAEWYHDKDLAQKAVKQEEIQKLASQITPIQTEVRKTIYLDTMYAQKKRRNNSYKNVFLYGEARIKDREFIFDHDKRPGSAVKIEFPKAMDAISVSMDIYIPSEYRTLGSPAGDYGEAMGGRIVELRSGTLYVAKIKFFASGAVKISEWNGNIWQPKFHFFDLLRFDEYNRLEIVNRDGKATFHLNGQEIANIRGISQGKVDNLFLEGSMLVWSYWKVKNLTVCGKPFLFEKDSDNHPVQNIGKVSLPYAIGTEENKDCELHLSGSFEAVDSEKVYLTTDTLDPCGKVFVNGIPVLDTDSFERNCMDITSCVQKGRNEVKIIVMPRAPEVNYYWHRHTDCYNGWWCGEVKIEFVSNVHIQSVIVETVQVAPCVKAKIKTELNRNVTGSMEFFLKKIHPNCTGEAEKNYSAGREDTGRIRLGSVTICGRKAEYEFSGSFGLWEINEPNLYEIRAVLKDKNGKALDDYVEETGFRTISQKDGKLYLNGKRIIMTGALAMQFPGPFSQIPVNHNCPSTEQIAWQALALKAMRGNCLRLHLLGYGTNEKRYARILDRAGVMAIWTTRYIDTIETLAYNKAVWLEKERFSEQAKAVINHPSIVMWEGSNEFHGNLMAIDRMYTEFVDAVKEFDQTRLICPLSHHYSTAYASTDYYDDEGRVDRQGHAVSAGRGWKDPQVVRSSHPYAFFCGYGRSWTAMRTQMQDLTQKPHLENANSKKHAYLATEYAVVALPNAETKEAKEAEYIESYEAGSAYPVFGRIPDREEWRLSQAVAALCAFHATKLMRELDFDGMLWCCLSGGANNGSYMKPPIDFYGYKKLSFYALRDAFSDCFVTKEDLKICYGTEDELAPMLFVNHADRTVKVRIQILDDNDRVIFEKNYESIRITAEDGKRKLSAFKPKFVNAGYYTVRYVIETED